MGEFMSTKKEKKLVGEGDFTIIRETARYIESLSDNSFECSRLDKVGDW